MLTVAHDAQIGWDALVIDQVEGDVLFDRPEPSIGFGGGFTAWVERVLVVNENGDEWWVDAGALPLDVTDACVESLIARAKGEE